LPRLYLKLILPIALIFLVLTLTASALGTTQPPNPALRGFTEGCEDKPQPCWYGIVLGETTLDAVHETLARVGYSITSEEFACCGMPIKYLQAESKGNRDCKLSMDTFPINTDPTDPNQRVHVIVGFELVDCKGLMLGDVFIVLPNPIVAYSCSSVSGELTFRGGFWLNLNPPFSFTGITRVNDPIYSISASLFSDNIKSRNLQIDPFWYGFMPQWKLNRIIYNKYCQYG
jgi:hypothetical protein